MIRLLIFSLVRFIVVALLIYFILTLIQRVMGFLREPPAKRQSRHTPPQPVPPKTEEYKDVQDAHFEEIPPKKSEPDAPEQKE